MIAKFSLFKKKEYQDFSFSYLVCSIGTGFFYFCLYYGLFHNQGRLFLLGAMGINFCISLYWIRFKKQFNRLSKVFLFVLLKTIIECTLYYALGVLSFLILGRFPLLPVVILIFLLLMRLIFYSLSYDVLICKKDVFSSIKNCYVGAMKRKSLKNRWIMYALILFTFIVFVAFYTSPEIARISTPIAIGIFTSLGMIYSYPLIQGKRKDF